MIFIKAESGGTLVKQWVTAGVATLGYDLKLETREVKRETPKLQIHQLGAFRDARLGDVVVAVNGSSGEMLGIGEVNGPYRIDPAVSAGWPNRFQSHKRVLPVMWADPAEEGTRTKLQEAKNIFVRAGLKYGKGHQWSVSVVAEGGDAAPPATPAEEADGDSVVDEKTSRWAAQRKAVFDAVWAVDPTREVGVVAAKNAAATPTADSAPDFVLASVPTQNPVLISFQVKTGDGQETRTANQLKKAPNSASAWTMLWFRLSPQQRMAAEGERPKHPDIVLELRATDDGGAWLRLPNAPKSAEAVPVGRESTLATGASEAAKGRPVAAAPARPPAPHPLNLLLEGVPGTGKTFKVKEIVGTLCGEHDKPNHVCRVAGNGQGHYAITMHPATTYEEFVEGLRPAAKREISAGSVSIQRGGALENDPTGYFWTPVTPMREDAAFVMTDGFFVRVCAEAVRHGAQVYLVLLDEFNRCNIPKVLGDLLTTLEPSKRARWSPNANGGEGAWDLDQGAQVVTLPGSGRLFFVPDNVYVVATMNSSDRSVGSVDAALRRRFAADRVWPHGFGPDPSLCDAEVLVARIKEDKGVAAFGTVEATVRKSIIAWCEFNKLARDISPDAMLGHSYLFDLTKSLEQVSKPPSADRRFFIADRELDVVLHVWNQQILPQLCESLEASHKTPADGDWPKALEEATRRLGVGLEPSSLSGGASLLRRPSIRFRELAKEPPAQDRPPANGPPSGSEVEDIESAAATSVVANAPGQGEDAASPETATSTDQ